MRRRLREVAEGQWFRKRGSGGGVWEVVAVRRDARGAEHAQLRRHGDHSDLKTLSTSALLDSSLYESVAAPHI